MLQFRILVNGEKDVCGFKSSITLEKYISQSQKTSMYISLFTQQFKRLISQVNCLRTIFEILLDEQQSNHELWFFLSKRN